ISYILPTVSGMIAYKRTWKKMGPWQLGWLYRPLALVCVLGGAMVMVIGMAPPNDWNIYIVGGAVVVLTVWWWTWERKRFAGPPLGIMSPERQAEGTVEDAAVAGVREPVV